MRKLTLRQMLNYFDVNSRTPIEDLEDIKSFRDYEKSFKPAEFVTVEIEDDFLTVYDSNNEDNKMLDRVPIDNWLQEAQAKEIEKYNNNEKLLETAIKVLRSLQEYDGHLNNLMMDNELSYDNLKEIQLKLEKVKKQY